MIYFDVSRTAFQNHRSGLTRVTRRLYEEFGASVQQLSLFRAEKKGSDFLSRFPGKAEDWWLTAELFCEDEFPGLWSFVRGRPGRLAAIYHDSIPLKFPHITWPQSVARHAGYVKMLAEFDRVFAVSEASRNELMELWAWQGVDPRAVVETVALGADFARQARVTELAPRPCPALLCVGILEPRKNQSFLLDVCDRLWRKGLVFELHLVGRVNPHFGRPLLAKIRALQATWRCLHFHESIGDDALAALYARSTASVFPTMAEGCGLPLLESLWMGVPCVCSDLPVLRENADGGGCLAVPLNDAEAWCHALAALINEPARHENLARAAMERLLPIWSGTAQSLIDRLV